MCNLYFQLQEGAGIGLLRIGKESELDHLSSKPGLLWIRCNTKFIPKASKNPSLSFQT